VLAAKSGIGLLVIALLAFPVLAQGTLVVNAETKIGEVVLYIHVRVAGNFTSDEAPGVIKYVNRTDEIETKLSKTIEVAIEIADAQARPRIEELVYRVSVTNDSNWVYVEVEMESEVHICGVCRPLGLYRMIRCQWRSAMLPPISIDNSSLNPAEFLIPNRLGPDESVEAWERTYLDGILAFRRSVLREVKHVPVNCTWVLLTEYRPLDVRVTGDVITYIPLENVAAIVTAIFFVALAVIVAVWGRRRERQATGQPS